MSIVGGPFAIVALVLAVSGLFKLRDPASTSELLRVLSGSRSSGPAPPPRRVAVTARILGVAELAVGTAAVVVGGAVLVALVASAYAVFASVNLRLLRLGSEAPSCGCFGRWSTPPSTVHVVVDVLAAVVALAALPSETGVVTAWAAQGPVVALQLSLVALGAWLLIAVLTVLPPTLQATRRGPRPAAIPTFELNRSPW